MDDLRWPSRPRRFVTGALAGLIAGGAFALLLHWTGQLFFVARLVGATGTGVAWLVHLLLGVFFGALFGLIVAARAPARELAYAVVWGLVLWATGWMLAMRMWLGMPLAFDTLARVGLAGHIIYGFALGIVYAGLRSVTHEARLQRLAY